MMLCTLPFSFYAQTKSVSLYKWKIDFTDLDSKCLTAYKLLKKFMFIIFSILLMHLIKKTHKFYDRSTDHSLFFLCSVGQQFSSELNILYLFLSKLLKFLDL